MDLLPFRKPTAKALIEAIPEEDRKNFVKDLLEAALSMESDKDAVGYVTMILFRDGKRRLWWNTRHGAGMPLERALRRSSQEIVEFLRTKED